MKHRNRDLGFGHNTELMVVVAIIGILAAIAIPNLLKFRDKRAVICLGNLLAQADGTLAKDAVCPFSKKPYAAGDVLTCPEPAKHLESKPRLARSKDGPWRFEQTLPAYAAGPIEIKSGRVEVKTHPGRTALLVKPGGFARFFMGPLAFLIFGVWCLFAAAKCFWGFWTRKWEDGILSFFGMGIAGAIAYFAMTGFATSHEWVVERSGARVTRVDYLFGARRSEKTVEGCLAVVPTKASGGHRLHLVHPPATDGSRTTPLELIAEDRLDLADWFNRALLGP